MCFRARVSSTLTTSTCTRCAPSTWAPSAASTVALRPGWAHGESGQGPRLTGQDDLVSLLWPSLEIVFLVCLLLLLSILLPTLTLHCKSLCCIVINLSGSGWSLFLQWSIHIFLDDSASQSANFRHASMKFTGGQTCWNGPARSSAVFLHCGGENSLTSVSEPNRSIFNNNVNGCEWQ